MRDHTIPEFGGDPVLGPLPYNHQHYCQGDTMDADPGRLSARHYVIQVPNLPPSANDRRRATWPVIYRAGKVFRDAVAWQARSLVAGAPPLERAHVVATLVYKRRPFRDEDSACASLKETIDGLVVGGMMVSDSPDHMRLEVRQEVGLVRRVQLDIQEVCREG